MKCPRTNTNMLTNDTQCTKAILIKCGKYPEHCGPVCVSYFLKRFMWQTWDGFLTWFYLRYKVFVYGGYKGPKCAVVFYVGWRKLKKCHGRFRLVYRCSFQLNFVYFWKIRGCTGDKC